jgi:hemoglobin
MDDEFRSAEERRAAIVALAEKETGIDETMIETLIRAFYARVRQDALLAPIFESRIADWGLHLDNMFAFWSSLTLHTGRYHGQPMAKHMPLAWMRATSIDGSHCSRRRRARFARRPRRTGSSSTPRRVAQSLELGVASANGVLLSKGERYWREA